MFALFAERPFAALIILTMAVTAPQNVNAQASASGQIAGLDPTKGKGALDLVWNFGGIAGETTTTQTGVATDTLSMSTATVTPPWLLLPTTTPTGSFGLGPTNPKPSSRTFPSLTGASVPPPHTGSVYLRSGPATGLSGMATSAASGISAGTQSTSVASNIRWTLPKGSLTVAPTIERVEAPSSSPTPVLTPLGPGTPTAAFSVTTSATSSATSSQVSRKLQSSVSPSKLSAVHPSGSAGLSKSPMSSALPFLGTAHTSRQPYSVWTILTVCLFSVNAFV